MEPGADGFGAHRMRKGKVPDDITCCFRFDQIRSRTDRQEARARRSLKSCRLQATSLDIPA